ncbi:hypothetical protein HHL22_03180 [Hymenobacter sp. RP-2-7]|uniref:Outer membrane protein beta-barrel domain-containing protein n=1 Tax=Hymenobacter polaris TaxID=2682546 RepID=A0A7Y0FL64_9BACT|nr:hypothetical protein [Hymenobacter polaris]NML64200.1 hypothetical protein [Hymenobacter polaris]
MKLTRSFTAAAGPRGLMLIMVYWLSCLGTRPAQAQQVLLQTNVATDTIAPRTGPNRPWFGHVYLGYAPAVGASALGVKYGFGSAETLVGGRLKRRLTGGLALCADLRYGYLRYQLNPDANHPAPFRTDPEADQHLAYHQAQGELSLRLNPERRRGNVLGRYLDVLAYGGYALGTTYAAEQPAPGGGQQEVVVHQPPYLARWLGGVGVRVGSNSLALVGRYRLNDALRSPAFPAEPPRFTVGVELSWL